MKKQNNYLFPMRHLLVLMLTLLWLPLAIICHGATYNVRNSPYNAKGDGITDDYAAINTAIQNAVTAGSGNTVYIPAGRYYLGSGYNDWQHFDIGNANNLTITGDGATTLLLTDGKRTFFYLWNCTNLTFQSFASDYQVINQTQGTITAVKTNMSPYTATVTIDDGYPAPNVSYLLPNPSVFSSAFEVVTDPSRYNSGGDWLAEDQVTNVTIGTGGTWVLGLSWAPNATSVGKAFYMTGNHFPYWMFDMEGVVNMAVTNVANYCAGGMYIVGGSGTHTFTKYYCGPPPGSNRRGCYGGHQGGGPANLVLNNCDFYSGDDGVNKLSTLDHVLAQTATNRITPSGWGYNPGDQVAIWDNRNVNAPYCRDIATVNSTALDGNGNQILTLSKSVQIINVGPAVGNGETDGIDRVCNLSNGSITITNTRCTARFARPLLIKSGVSTMISNCKIYGCSQGGIQAGMEFYWNEGPQNRNLTVQNCEFFDCDGPCIDIGVMDNGGTSTASLDQTNILIQNNIFRRSGLHPTWNWLNARGVGVHISNVNGGIVKSNTFIGIWPNNVWVENSKNIQINNNLFIDPNREQFPMFDSDQEGKDNGRILYVNNSANVSTSNNSVINQGSYGTGLYLFGTNVTGSSGSGLTVNTLNPPPAPAALNATPTNGQIILTWHSSSGASMYTIKRAAISGGGAIISENGDQTESGGYLDIGSSKTTNYSDTLLANGTTYYYVVTAISSSGQSAKSTEVSATPSPVLNPGFESLLSNWTINPSGITVVAGTDAPHTGSYDLGEYSATAWTADVYQYVTVANGTYTLTAWVRSSGGFNANILYADQFGGSGSMTVNIPATSTYQKIAISGIVVTNGQIKVGFWSDAPAGMWNTIDDIVITGN